MRERDYGKKVQHTFHDHYPFRRRKYHDRKWLGNKSAEAKRQTAEIKTGSATMKTERCGLSIKMDVGAQHPHRSRCGWLDGLSIRWRTFKHGSKDKKTRCLNMNVN